MQNETYVFYVRFQFSKARLIRRDTSNSRNGETELSQLTPEQPTVAKKKKKEK